MSEPILRAENLTKYYDTSSGFLDDLLGRSRKVKAVESIDFELQEGETLGIVGESGCGKTSLGRTLLRLIEPTEGAVYYRGEDLMELSSRELRDRRKDLQYIFQDPFSSLNPRLTIGDIIGEPLDIHGIATGEERTERINELLEIVGLNSSHTNRYPHEFSGGQRQRIGIARALAVDPEVVVCDEPVSALDVSVQAQILNLLEDLQEEFGLSYIFIAHDLSVVEHIADRVAVMYLGQFAEVGPTEDVYASPSHPYTKALLSAIPEPDPLWEGEKILLSGDVPSPIDPPSGCRFHTRCPRVIQPPEYDLTQTEWRSLLNFKHRLEEAETLGALLALEEQEDIQADPDDLHLGTFESSVRNEFGLPETLSDQEAQRVFTRVIERAYDGDRATAVEVAREAFESPCERVEPELVSAGGEHRISCLLFDDEWNDGLAEKIRETDDAIADD